MKENTLVGIKTIGLYRNVSYEEAQIARWHKSYGDKSKVPEGFYLVKFADGAKRTVHESNIVVF